MIGINFGIYVCVFFPGFHSCVSGGCNGCLETSSAKNAGLKPVVERLNKISRALGLNKIASRADLYALAATVAAEVGLAEAVKKNAS